MNFHVKLPLLWIFVFFWCRTEEIIIKQWRCGRQLADYYMFCTVGCITMNFICLVENIFSPALLIISLESLVRKSKLQLATSYWQPNLNKFLALGRPAWKEARATLQRLLSCMITISLSCHLI